MLRKIAIIAGTGLLPSRILFECLRQGREALVITFVGENENKEIEEEYVRRMPLGAVGKTLKLLKEERCLDVVLAGSFHRPPLSSIIGLDSRGFKLIAKIMKSGGDDGTLRVIIKELETEGLNVIGVEELLPSLLMDTGVLTNAKPLDVNSRDIEFGLSLLRSLASFDVGQSVVVASRRVLGIEGPEGTDSLIERCANLCADTDAPVLIKACKLNQDRRVDLPTVGPRTIPKLEQSGYAGIALEAGNTIILDKSNFIQAANAAGLFVVGILNNQVNLG